MNDQVEQATEKTITIAGEEFTLPIKYQAGHVLSPTEAAVLSQTWCENVRNNMAKHVKAAKDEENEMTLPQAKKIIAEYAESYEFSLAAAGGSTASLSPEEKEARKIARSVVNEAIKAKGVKLSDVRKDDERKEKYEAKIIELAASERVVKLAKKRVKEARDAAGDIAENLGVV